MGRTAKKAISKAIPKPTFKRLGDVKTEAKIDSVGYTLSAHDDIALTIDLYKAFSYPEKEAFLNSSDGMVFARKIRFSKLAKGLTQKSLRTLDILAGTENAGYWGAEGKNEGAVAEPVVEDASLYLDKQLQPNNVENSIRASVMDDQAIWTKSSDLMQQFHASAESIDRALEDSLADGRVAKVLYLNEWVYAIS